MSERVIAVVLSLAGGVGLGAAYFAGLWWTVRLVPRVCYPGLLLSVSFGGRVAILLLGFYVMMSGRWERAVACLVGFLVARTVMLHRLRPCPPCEGEPQGVGRRNPTLAAPPSFPLRKGGGCSPSSPRKETSTSHG